MEYIDRCIIQYNTRKKYKKSTDYQHVLKYGDTYMINTMVNTCITTDPKVQIVNT